MHGSRTRRSTSAFVELAGIDPNQALLVDDKIENVIAARAAGLGGIVFSKQSDVIMTLRSIYGQPAERGRAFLEARAGELWSVTDTQVTFGENFTQLLLLELTNDKYVPLWESRAARGLTYRPRSLVQLDNRNHLSNTWNFFQGRTQFTRVCSLLTAA